MIFSSDSSCRNNRHIVDGSFLFACFFLFLVLRHFGIRPLLSAFLGNWHWMKGSRSPLHHHQIGIKKDRRGVCESVKHV
jgi:hypothetical protein